MVSSSLNVGEMHLLKAIIEILNQNLGKPMIPSHLIIPKLSRFLKPMLAGRIIIVPQAAVRRLWVERGLGIAISYEEKRRMSNANDPVGTIDLSKTLGTTEMHLYKRTDAELSEAAAFLVQAVTTIFSREPLDDLPGRRM